MAAGLLYRRGSLDDLQQITDLGLLSYGEFAHVLTDAHWATMQHNLQDPEQRHQLIEQAATFVCADRGYIAGMAFLVPSGNPTAIYPADWAYIRMVGVDPAYRGQGIARKLTQQCIDHARQTDEKTIGLHTSEMMDAARHIYESLGFTIDREIDPLFGKKYWLYRLDITTTNTGQL